MPRSAIEGRFASCAPRMLRSHQSRNTTRTISRNIALIYLFVSGLWYAAMLVNPAITKESWIYLEFVESSTGVLREPFCENEDRQVRRGTFLKSATSVPAIARIFLFPRDEYIITRICVLHYTMWSRQPWNNSHRCTTACGRGAARSILHRENLMRHYYHKIMVCRGVMMDYENIGAINLHDTRCLHARTLLFVHRRTVRRIDRCFPPREIAFGYVDVKTSTNLTRHL